MATAAEHNQIIKIKFSGNTHLKHVLSNDEIRQMTMIEGRFPLTKLPVCGHCEKLGLWSRDILNDEIIGICKSCGTITKKPITYSTYLASKQDVDETGDTFRRMATIDKDRDYVNRFIYLPEFNMNGGMIDGFDNNKSYIQNVGRGNKKNG